MKRRDFIKNIGLSLASFTLPGCSRAELVPPPSQRPNILWLISEDTSPDFGCYGNKLVRTPNLDRLASEGALYTRAYVTGPVCSASRSAFMTGMYQTTIGAQNHRSHRRDGYTLPEPVEVITQYFRRAGYFTSNTSALNFKRLGKTDWNFKPKSKPFDGSDWSERRAHQPFFAQINFHLTHRPFKRDPANPIDPSMVQIPPYYPDHPVTRRDWADYLESIQLLDGQIGQVLKRLDEQGLSENTIVVYIGDHGRCHVRGKQWLYEGGIHIPMIIRWPGHIKAGTVVDNLVSTIDFAPTFMSLAGITPPRHLQGKIFLGPGTEKRNYIFAARDRCDETVDRIRCVVTPKYKYIRNYMPDRPYTQFNAYKKKMYPVLTLMQVLYKQGKLTPAQSAFMASGRPPEELYDIETDPYEIHNIADDPQYQSVLKQLRNRLIQWCKQTGDQGKIPEDPQVIAYWKKEARQRYRKWLINNKLPLDISDEDYLKWWEKKLST